MQCRPPDRPAAARWQRYRRRQMTPTDDDRRQTPTDDSMQNNTSPPTPCVGGPVMIIERYKQQRTYNARWLGYADVYLYKWRVHKSSSTAWGRLATSLLQQQQRPAPLYCSRRRPDGHHGRNMSTDRGTASRRCPAAARTPVVWHHDCTMTMTMTSCRWRLVRSHPASSDSLTNKHSQVYTPWIPSNM